VWPDAVLARYGSTVTGLCENDSDVDLVVLLPSHSDILFTESAEQALAIYQALANWDGVTSLEVLPQARVPVVNFVDAETGLVCDLSVNNTYALCNTALITGALKQAPLLKQLVQVVREWSAARGLWRVEATLSSYAWTLLCIGLFVRRGELPRVDVLEAGVDYSVPAVAKDVDHFRQSVERLMGAGKRKRVDSEDGKARSEESQGDVAELFFDFVKHISCGINYKQHEVLSMRQEAPYFRTDGPWETGKHALPRLRLEDPVEQSRNLAQYLNKRTHAQLHLESARYFPQPPSPQPLSPLSSTAAHSSTPGPASSWLTGLHGTR